MLSFLWSIAVTEVKIRLKKPPSDASIEMFIVGSKHRGKGIGSALIDRFLEAAIQAGSRLVTVYTDDRQSDWQFYERRGFKRVASFYDNVTSHYSGSQAHGLIYALELVGEGR